MRMGLNMIADWRNILCLFGHWTARQTDGGTDSVTKTCFNFKIHFRVWQERGRDGLTGRVHRGNEADGEDHRREHPSYHDPGRQECGRVKFINRRHSTFQLLLFPGLSPSGSLKPWWQLDRTRNCSYTPALLTHRRIWYLFLYFLHFSLTNIESVFIYILVAML